MVDSTRAPSSGGRLAAPGRDAGAQARLDASASSGVAKRTVPEGRPHRGSSRGRKRPGRTERSSRKRGIVESTIYHHNVIGRLWYGRTRPEHAQLYEEHLRRTTLPSLQRIASYKGAYVLRRDVDGGVEFAVLTLWGSLDALRSFGGDDYETAVVPPAARELLQRFDDKAVHFEVVIQPD